MLSKGFRQFLECCSCGSTSVKIANAAVMGGRPAVSTTLEPVFWADRGRGSVVFVNFYKWLRQFLQPMTVVIECYRCSQARIFNSCRQFL